MSKSMRDYSDKQEGAIASALGWEVVAGSGAAACTPGDVIGENWLGECKTHTSEQKIFFDFAVWEKIEKEAAAKHRCPVLFVDDGSQDVHHTWALCYAHNLNQSLLLTTDLPMKVRKNITFTDTFGRHTLRKAVQGNIFRPGQRIAFEHQWGPYKVAVLPFDAFQEIYEK